MSAAIVQSGKATSAGAALSLTTPSITPSAIGDVFYVFAGYNGSSGLITGSNITDTNNNQYTFLGFNSDASSNVAVYACVLNSTTAMTVKSTYGGSVLQDIVWAECSGLGSGGVGQQKVSGSTGSTSVSVPTVTNTAGDVVFCAVYDQSHASTFTFPAGWNPLQTTANTSSSLSVAYQLPTSPGTVGGGNVTVGSSSSGLALFIQDYYFAVGSARVSQVAPEGVLKENPNVRVSQVAPEGVLTENPNVRASQLAIEAVLGENPHVIISQVGLEILLPYSPPVQRPVFTYIATT